MLGWTAVGGGADLEGCVGGARSTTLNKMAATRRALHFVFKVADRTSTAAFYRDVLGMKVSTS